MSVYGVLVLAAYGTFLPETQLYRRSASLLHSLARAFAAYGRVFVRPGPVGLVLCTSGGTGSLIAVIASVPFVYIEHFGLSERLFAIWYAGNMVAFLIASIINSRLVGRHGPLVLARVGAGIALAAALLFLLAAVTGVGGFFGVAIPVVFVLAAVGFTSANGVALLGRAFPLNGGMAAAAMLATQFMTGTLLIALINHLPGQGALPLSLAVLLGEAGSLVGIFWMAGDEMARPPATQEA